MSEDRNDDRYTAERAVIVALTVSGERHAIVPAEKMLLDGLFSFAERHFVSLPPVATLGRATPPASPGGVIVTRAIGLEGAVAARGSGRARHCPSAPVTPPPTTSDLPTIAVSLALASAEPPKPACFGPSLLRLHPGALLEVVAAFLIVASTARGNLSVGPLAGPPHLVGGNPVVGPARQAPPTD